MTKSKLFGIRERRSDALDRLNSSLEDIETLLLKDRPESQLKLLKTQKKRMLKEVAVLEVKKNYSRKNR